MSRDGNRLHDANLGMLKAADNFLTDNATAVTATGVGVITEYQGLLQPLIAEIELTMEITKQPTQGITLTKKQARLQAIETAILIAQVLFNYATDNMRPDIAQPASIDNPDDPNMVKLLEFATKYVGKYLYKKSDQHIISHLENIWLEASAVAEVTPPVVNPLLIYGLKDDTGTVGQPTYEAGTLTKFKAAIEAYDGKSTSPKEAISKRTTANEKLTGLFIQALNILGQMDFSFGLVKARNLNLYNGYMNIRQVSVMTFATQIVGTVFKMVNGVKKVAVGAKIIVTGSSYETEEGTLIPKPVEMQVDANGEFSVRTPKIKSIYTLKCILAGYETVTLTDITVRKGKKKKVQNEDVEGEIVLLPTPPQPENNG